jgi:hypothetical protein
MSSIRKLKRYKFLRKKYKTSSKLSLGDIVFYIGVSTILVGVFYGIYNYCVYTSGRAEHTIESKGGPIHYSEEAPGNPGRKDSAATAWKICGIGILLMILSMVICIIDEVLHGVIGKFQAKTGGKRLLRKGK